MSGYLAPYAALWRRSIANPCGCLPTHSTSGGIFTTPGEAYTAPVDMWIKATGTFLSLRPVVGSKFCSLFHSKISYCRRHPTLTTRGKTAFNSTCYLVHGHTATHNTPNVNRHPAGTSASKSRSIKSKGGVWFSNICCNPSFHPVSAPTPPNPIPASAAHSQFMGPSQCGYALIAGSSCACIISSRRLRRR